MYVCTYTQYVVKYALTVCLHILGFVLPDDGFCLMTNCYVFCALQMSMQAIVMTDQTSCWSDTRSNMQSKFLIYYVLYSQMTMQREI